MRLRDFTIAARALAGHVGPREAAKLATALADPLVACLTKDAWTARGAGGHRGADDSRRPFSQRSARGPPSPCGRRADRRRDRRRRASSSAT